MQPLLTTLSPISAATKKTTQPTPHSAPTLTNFSAVCPPKCLRPASTSTGKLGDSQVNGLGLCCGDVSSADCKTCVVGAAKELQSRCPYNKGAVIWYDNCLLKYSDNDFFGQIDDTNRFYMWNVQDVEDPKSFDPKVKQLLSSLSDKASAISKLYANWRVRARDRTGPDPKLYGLAQCTRDLKGLDCKKCLDDLISFFPNFSSGKRGGRVVGGSCYIGYELYPIVDSQKV
ncbi:hypothetical protein TIFTF001_027187 [Ficus carica]|uniref:Gnk2-homologous domain-containing protein n=1 Tax=Ficus carica TaxID=3494 RepID=A0AA88IZX2_FICCA|nr:hypothetical protein TIFTF001_027187 [Ficus carica]